MDFQRAMFARRFVQLQTRCKQKGNREKTKGEIKGKGPKDTSPSRQSHKLVCYQFQKGHCQKDPNPKVDANGGHVCIQDQATRAKLAKNTWQRNNCHDIGRDQGIQLLEIGWTPAKKN